MRRFLLTLSLLALIASTTAAGEKKTAPKIRVVGIQVLKPKADDKDLWFEFFSPSTLIQVIIELPDKAMLDIDRGASKLTSFQDDKKTDLSKSKNPILGPFGQSHWLQHTTIGKDKKRCLLRVWGGNAPTEGAGKVNLKALVAVQCGTSEKTAEQKEFALKKGNKEKMGPLSLEAMPAPFGPGRWQLTFKSEHPRIKQVECFDAEGKPLKVEPGFSFTGGFGKPVHQATYLVPTKQDTLSIKVTYFDKVEEVKVPIDVSVGLGL
jgi:hypothetical protein